MFTFLVSLIEITVCLGYNLYSELLDDKNAYIVVWILSTLNNILTWYYFNEFNFVLMTIEYNKVVNYTVSQHQWGTEQIIYIVVRFVEWSSPFQWIYSE